MTSMSEPDRLRLYIGNLFAHHFEHELADDLRHVADYFAFLAEGMQRPAIVGLLTHDRELPAQFEAVHLWVREALTRYPPTILQQLGEAFAKPDLCRLFSQLADLNPRLVERLAFGPMLPEQLSNLHILGHRLFSPRRPDLGQLRQDCDEARPALRRAAQILRYAASIEESPAEEVPDDLHDHYDPNLIDRNRLLALFGLLRVELNALPESSPARRLLPRIDAMEKEVRRTRVRWSGVIAGVFVLFSFLADLHELSPHTYEKALRVAQGLIQTLQQASPDRLPKLPAPTEPTPPVEIVLPPAPPEIPRPEEDA